MIIDRLIRDGYMWVDCIYFCYFLGFPGGSDGKEFVCNAGDLGSIPGLGRSLEKEVVTHSSVLPWRILMDRGAWWARVMG